MSNPIKSDQPDQHGFPGFRDFTGLQDTSQQGVSEILEVVR
jgi:hypothetical protein